MKQALGIVGKRLIGGALIISGLLFSSFALASIISGSSTTNTSTDVTYTQLAISKPSDATTTGDLLLANISINGGSTVTITPPTGWTLITRTSNGANVSIASYYKILGASEPATYAWSISPQTRAVGGITHYSGVDPINPIDTFAGSTGLSTTATAPSVTTSAAGDQVLALYAMSAGLTNFGNFSTPSGMTEKYDTSNTPFGPSVATDDIIKGNAGASGAFASAISTLIPTNWAAQTIALRKKPPLVISFVNSASGGNSSGTSFAFNSADCSGTDTYAMVGAIGGIPNDNVTSIFYGSAPMTFIDKAQVPGDRWMYLYGLTNPPTSVQTITVNGTPSDELGGNEVCYSGVRQTVQPEAHLTATSTNVNSIAGTVTTVTNGAWVVSAFFSGSRGSSGTSTDATQRVDEPAAVGFFDSNKSFNASTNAHLDINLPILENAAIITVSLTSD